MQCKTVREFDSSYTAKQFGYKDVNDYYANASIHDKLHKIEVPMLCLNAGDDPVQPYEGKCSTGLGFGSVMKVIRMEMCIHVEHT